MRSINSKYVAHAADRIPQSRKVTMLAPPAPVRLITAAIAALLLFISGVGQPPQDVAEAELIHYGDLIDIDVVGSLEFDWRGTLTPEGFLDGLVHSDEPVYALCRSEEQVASEIAKRFSKLLREPKVVVSILDRSNRAVAVLTGAVKNPQRFRIKRNVHLNELVVLAGGITDAASGSITIFRPRELNCFSTDNSGGQKASEAIRISIADLLSGKPEANPKILSGDVVSIVEALPIYVIGGVATPKQLFSREDLTLSRAIASAGGLSKSADESEVTIYRREARQSRVILVDLKRIREDEANDVPLKAFDIVDVAEKGRPKRKFPPTVSRADAGDREVYRLAIKVIE
jgi:protein involved in polysaccharide export with SLBB domain